MDNATKEFIEEQNGKLDKKIDESVDKLDQKIEKLDQKIDNQTEKILAAMAGYAQRVDEKFEKIDERFDNVEISIGKRHEEIDQLRDRVIVLERHTHIH